MTAPVALLHVDRLPGIRNSTAKLFGLAVSGIRMNLGKTPREMVAHDLKKDSDFPVRMSESWWSAIERGEVIPTSQHLDVMETLFSRNGLTGGVGLRDSIRVLEMEPFGELATEVRLKFQIDPSSDELDWDANSFGTSLTPIASELEGRDRFLVLGPLAVAIAMMMTALRLDVWAWSGEWQPSTIGSILQAAAIVGVAAFFMGALDGLLQMLASATRRSDAQLDQFHKLRKSAGLTEVSPHRWWIAQDQRHLLARVRNSHRSACLWTDFSERFRGLLVLAAGAQSVLAIASVTDRNIDALIPVLTWVLLITLVLVVSRNRARWELQARQTLIAGLGYSSTSSTK